MNVNKKRNIIIIGSVVAAIVIILILIVSISLPGKKPSDKAISVAKQAIKVTDDYLDGNISSSSANNKLDALRDDMSYVDDLPHGDKHKAKDFSIDVSILCISSSILGDNIKGNNETYDKIVEERNELAKKAGVKKR